MSDALRLCEAEVAELRLRVTDDYFAHQQEVAALLDLIEDLTIQGCAVDEGGLVDSLALSTYAEALLLLAEKGKYEIVSHRGRRVIARRSQDD